MSGELTNLQRDLISHTKKLGYFSTSKNDPDAKEFDELVELGLAKLSIHPSWMGGNATYVLTSKARNI